jgi:hypothetical protein
MPSWRQQQLVAEAAAAVQQQAVEHRVCLLGVHAQRIETHRDRDAAGVEAHEVRRKQDDRPTGVELGANLFSPFDADQAFQPLVAGPPEQAAFKDRATENAEVILHQFFSLVFAPFRKTQFEIHANNVPPLASKMVENEPERATDRRERLQGQEVQQPEQEDDRLAKEIADHGCRGMHGERHCIAIPAAVP